MSDTAALSKRAAVIVGNHDINAAVLRWDGTTWSEPVKLLTPGFSTFESVAKTSQGTVWTVGEVLTSGVRPLAMHYNGRRWTQQQPVVRDDNGYLFSVAAGSDADVWAGGTSTNSDFTLVRTLVEHWDGSRWSIVRSPNPGGLAARDELSDITVDSVGHVFALGAGTQGQFVLRRDGGRWTTLALPRLPGIEGELNDIYAVDARDVFLVGSYFRTFDSVIRPVVLHWDGSSFARIGAQNSTVCDSSWMTAVTAAPSGVVYAAGRGEGGTCGQGRGQGWRLARFGFVAMPMPRMSENYLAGIDAAADGAVFTGGTAHPLGAAEPFAEHLVPGG